MSGLVGAPVDVTYRNDPSHEEIARFAVEKLAEQENSSLQFVRLVKVTSQVVAGLIYHVVVEVKEEQGDGATKTYDARIYQRLDQTRTLESYKLLSSSDSRPGLTPADLGAQTAPHLGGWRSVPPTDPSVKDAAAFAERSIQGASNSLVPPSVKRVTQARAEVGDGVTFELTLEVASGAHTELTTAVVHRTKEGKFTLVKLFPAGACPAK